MRTCTDFILSKLKCTKWDKFIDYFSHNQSPFLITCTKMAAFDLLRQNKDNCSNYIGNLWFINYYIICDNTSSNVLINACGYQEFNWRLQNLFLRPLHIWYISVTSTDILLLETSKMVKPCSIRVSRRRFQQW